MLNLVHGYLFSMVNSFNALGCYQVLQVYPHGWLFISVFVFYQVRVGRNRHCFLRDCRLLHCPGGNWLRVHLNQMQSPSWFCATQVSFLLPDDGVQ